MARIFLSHSSADNVLACGFRRWLLDHGWSADDVFLDLEGIGAGTRWKDALLQANVRCEAVVFLASERSLASKECLAEIRTAENMGKEIIVALIDDLAPEDGRLVPFADRQMVNLVVTPRDEAVEADFEGETRKVAFNADALKRIAARLDDLGISPDHFAWEALPDLATASPYPGLTGFGQEHAGVFFGRGADIGRALSEIRRLRRTGPGVFMMVQAASGAGKSSFLRAGLWPRLQRDGDFVPLAIMRPAGGAIGGPMGLVVGLAAWFSAHGQPGQARSRAQIEQALDDPTGLGFADLINEAVSVAHGARRVVDPSAPAPAPVLVIDQAEELVTYETRSTGGPPNTHEAGGWGRLTQSERLVALLAQLLDETSEAGRCLFARPVVLATIRADSVDGLMQLVRRAGLDHLDAFLLPPIRPALYRDVIVGPAAVARTRGLNLTVDDVLADALVEDSTGADALPMMAFTLKHLLDAHRTGAKAVLTLKHYRQLGGVAGALGRQLDQLRADYDAARDPGAFDRALRALIIPHLATWDAAASPPAAKRLQADETALFAGDRNDLRALADTLVEARLLVRNASEHNASRTIIHEIAHEALLRQPPLSTWLDEDADFLAWRDGLAKAHQAHMAGSRGLLDDRELAIAADFINTRADLIDPQHQAFYEESLEAKKQRQEAEQDRIRRQQDAELAAAKAARDKADAEARAVRDIARRTRIGLAAAIVLSMFASAAGLWAWSSQIEAVEQATIAQQERDRAEEQTAIAEVEAKRAREAANQVLSTQSQFLISGAEDFLSLGRPAAAMALAWHGLPHDPDLAERPLVEKGLPVLTAARYERRLRDTFRGHQDGLQHAAFSPDGAMVVTASRDGTARLWSTETGAELAVLRGHDDWVRLAAFSPDGAMAVTASDDGTARLWSTQTGAEVLVLRGHQNRLQHAMFSPDGSMIVTASSDRTARLWSTQTGAEMAVLRGHDDWVGRAAFSPDGSTVLTGSADGTARLWSTHTGAEMVVLRGHDDWVSHAAFSPDGSMIVTASGDRTARLWSAQTGAETSVLRGHNQVINHAAFSPDGLVVVTASEDRTARLWSTQTGAELAVLRGYEGGVLLAAFSPDGSVIMTASDDGTARLWSAKTGNEIAVLRGHESWIPHAAFSPDGASIVTASGDGTARVWSVRSGANVMVLSGHKSLLQHAAFSPDGSMIATASEDNTARLWSVDSGAELAVLRGHEGWVTHAVFSPDGSVLMTGSSDGTARLWSTQTGAEMAVLRGHEAGVEHAAFSPDGTMLVTKPNYGPARLWSVETGAETAVFHGHEAAVSYAAFSPDGTMVVTASRDGTARLWSTQSGAELAILRGHDDWVRHVAFSPNGSMVVTASQDGTARLWSTETDAETAVLRGHDGWVTHAAFSPDGAMIVTASRDGTVRLWATQSGAELAVLRGDGNQVQHAAFSPEGSTIMAASSDGTARVWSVESAAEITVLRGADDLISHNVFSPDGSMIVRASLDGTAHIWPIWSDPAELIGESGEIIERLDPLSLAEKCQFLLLSELSVCDQLQ